MRSIKDWKENLRKTNPQKWLEEYRHFMYNPDNERRCEVCPYNRDFKYPQYPCGQYRCWVRAFCK